MTDFLKTYQDPATVQTYTGLITLSTTIDI